MNRFGALRFGRPTLVFFATAFWLLATFHCDLEGAGLWPDGHHGTSCCATEVACAQDGCEVVEDGAYKLSGATLKVAAPDLIACAFLPVVGIVPAANEDPHTPLPASDAWPESWVREWQFVRRAAMSPRAPSFVLA